MKKTLIPSLILIVFLAIVALAETSLFEDVHVKGNLTVTNTTTGVTMDSGGFPGITDVGFPAILSSTNASGGKGLFEVYFSPAAGTASVTLYGGAAPGGGILMFAQGVSPTQVINIGSGASSIIIGNTVAVGTVSLGFDSADILVINAATASSPNGLNLNSSQWIFPSSPTGTTTNGSGGLTSLGTITASNFVQSAGSAGGFVGNGSGLTNLNFSGVGGFTPGSAIFAGATGALSQDNPNYFWDITNRRLGVGLNTGLLAKVHVVATNGVVFSYMADSYSSTSTDDASGFIGRRARGTQAVPTAVTTGDILTRVAGRGYGTTGFSPLGRAMMQFEASETWTDTAQGARTVFYVTPVTTTNIAEAMRIHNDGSVGIGTNAIVSATKLYVNGSIGASTSVYAGGSPLISATNTFIGVSVGGVTGDLSATYVTNVLADFPSILAAAFADISYPVTSTIITNMVVNVGSPSTENGSLAVNGYVSSNGFITIRARNVGGIAVDQGNLPYRISVDKIPTLNTLP